MSFFIFYFYFLFLNYSFLPSSSSSTTSDRRQPHDPPRPRRPRQKLPGPEHRPDHPLDDAVDQGCRDGGPGRGVFVAGVLRRQKERSAAEADERSGASSGLVFVPALSRYSDRAVSFDPDVALGDLGARGAAREEHQ